MEKPHKNLRGWQLEIAKRFEFVDLETWKMLDKKLIEEDKVLSGLIRKKKSVGS